MKRLRLGVVAGLFSCAPLAAAPGAATAQVAPEPDPQPQRTAQVRQAHVQFERGREAYRRGELERARVHLQRAYELAPSPELAFNLARVHERMGEVEPALRLFARYLQSAQPKPAERKRIEARMTELRALSARQHAQSLLPPPSPAELTAEARAFFERGTKLFRRRRYTAALAAFAAARRFTRLPELSYNLALVCERLGRTEEAAEHYRAYLREAEQPKDAERVRAHVRSLLEGPPRRRPRTGSTGRSVRPRRRRGGRRGTGMPPRRNGAACPSRAA